MFTATWNTAVWRGEPLVDGGSSADCCPCLGCALGVVVGWYQDHRDPLIDHLRPRSKCCRHCFQVVVAHCVANGDSPLLNAGSATGRTANQDHCFLRNDIQLCILLIVTSALPFNSIDLERDIPNELVVVIRGAKAISIVRLVVYVVRDILQRDRVRVIAAPT